MLNYILGVDLGLTGDNPAAATLIRIDGGVARWVRSSYCAPSMLLSWPERVQHVAAWLDEFIKICGPVEAVGYEAPHLGKGQNAQTLRKLAAIEGAILRVCYCRRLPCVDVQPVEAKIALTGDMRATKQMMITQAKRVYDARLSAHEADALGVALHAEAVLRRRYMVEEARHGDRG